MGGHDDHRLEALIRVQVKVLAPLNAGETQPTGDQHDPEQDQDLVVADRLGRRSVQG